MNLPATPAPADVSRTRAGELIDWLRRYAAERINSRLIDERRCVPPYVILDFGNRGLLGMQVPEAYGGLGLRHADYLRVLEQLAAIDQTLAAIVFTHSVLGTRPILGYATPATRDEILPLLASGRELAAFALSEPAAGSNVAGVTSQARPDGQGGWRLRGLKRWNSSAWAGVVSVFARAVDGHSRPGGLTGFVVRQGSPGLRTGPEAMTMGLRGSVQSALALDDVAVGPEHLLGEPGRGMEVAEDALSVGRLGIAAVCVGGLKRCVQLLARYGGRRTVATGCLLDNPVVLAALGEMTALIDALGALKDQVAERFDSGRPVPPEVPMAAKVIGSEGLNRGADRLMQFLGGRGYMENNLAPQILRDARLWSIGEGPNEPLTTQVGRKARHTRAIGEYLAANPHGAELAGVLADVVPEIVDRLHATGPFPDHSTAQVWADTLIGRFVSEALLLAATRAAHHRSPSDRLERALRWNEARFARALRRARDGRPEDSLIPTAEVVELLAADYAGAIGDVEQNCAGEDEELDPFLRKSPSLHAGPLPEDLPGQATVPCARGPAPSDSEATQTPSGQAKRELLAQLLRHRLESPPAVSGSS
jgi:alkylation response protein AidB-like acyl-CoA dehydrogenase